MIALIKMIACGIKRLIIIFSLFILYPLVIILKPVFFANACNVKGAALAYFGKYQKAIESFDLAIKYQPEDYKAYYNRGLALAYLGKYQEAIESYDLAIKLKPDFVDSYNNKGTALAYLGKYQEAINTFDLAIKYQPENYKAHHNKRIALNILDMIRQLTRAQNL